MTVFQRAATIAAVAFSFVGLSVSSPGLAYEMDRTPVIGDSTQVPGIPVPAFDIPAMLPSATQAMPAPKVDAPAKADDGTTRDDVDSYASLAAAVADQDVPDAVADDLTCLAGAVYFESKGEPLDGQLAVAEVILNRAKSGRFPKSICSVVTQRGQFSFVRGGHIPTVDPARSQYRTALAIAQVAMSDSWDSKASEAMYFHARRVSPSWGKTRIASIGNHIFYR